LRHLGNDNVAVKSAGIEAHGKNPKAIAVMKEAGVDISTQESTRLTQEMIEWADLLITVCGHANENCPVLPPGKAREHWPIEDPAKASGAEDEVLNIFRGARDEIRSRVLELLNRPGMREVKGKQ